MKNVISILFHFLGGIYFAIFLIAVTAFMVLMGTFIESKTGSHLLAAEWTYANPFFFTLLFLFFINILFSAMRRWPFKQMHIPFLLTHLGLLMLIGGTMLKNSIGIQGQMFVVEGSASDQVVLPHTYALAIEKKNALNPSDKNIISKVSFASFAPTICHPYHFPSLQCKLIGYATHVKETYTTWIKNSLVSVVGFPSIPLVDWKPGEIFPEKILHHYAQDDRDWSLSAIQTEYVDEAIREDYLQDMQINIQSKGDPNKWKNLLLREAVENDVSINDEHFSFSFSTSSAHILIRWKKDNGPEYQYTLPLNGENALEVQTASWKDAPFTIDLSQAAPTLCIIQSNEKTVFCAVDAYGRIHTQENDTKNKPIFSYDDGFQGYSVQTSVPFPHLGRVKMEEMKADYLSEQMTEALSTNTMLIPPLRLLLKACANRESDCASSFIEFLRTWNHGSSVLFDNKASLSLSLSKIVSNILWNELSNEEWQSILWTKKIITDLEDSLMQGLDLFEILEEHHWPFLSDLKQGESNNSVLNVLAKQISSIIDYLPKLPLPDPISFSEIDSAQYLSAYFRIYGIDYRSFIGSQNMDQSFISLKKVLFETPLEHEIIPIEPPIKKEEHRPGIVLELKEGDRNEKIALAYDPTLHGFKWPAINGKYLLRLEPQQKQIPYRIRLREARQILYPQSQQTYSYESDVWVYGKDGSSFEETLSMNHVYESWDGYRFYLSGIGNWLGSDIRFIQLAVNYDPAKIWLTYPGAFFVFLGSLLLLWMNPYKKQARFSESAIFNH